MLTLLYWELPFLWNKLTNHHNVFSFNARNSLRLNSSCTILTSESGYILNNPEFPRTKTNKQTINKQKPLPNNLAALKNCRKNSCLYLSYFMFVLFVLFCFCFLFVFLTNHFKQHKLSLFSHCTTLHAYRITKHSYSVTIQSKMLSWELGACHRESPKFEYFVWQKRWYIMHFGSSRNRRNKSCNFIPSR